MYRLVFVIGSLTLFYLHNKGIIDLSTTESFKYIVLLFIIGLVTPKVVEIIKQQN